MIESTQSVSWLDKDFTLIDTGGIEPESKDIILSQMREQAQIAIDTCRCYYFYYRCKAGACRIPILKLQICYDEAAKPVILVVNKVDNFDKVYGRCL